MCGVIHCFVIIITGEYCTVHCTLYSNKKKVGICAASVYLGYVGKEG
jgi:hypothetical protein